MMSPMQPTSIDTIAAIATPPGIGGIAVIRVSGSAALDVLRKLFHPSYASRIGRGAASPPGSVETTFHFKPRYMHFGQIRDSAGELLDEGLAVYMPGPHSFTGEDVAEVHCHGGMGVSLAILEAAREAGARVALPGEFSRRAFLNGRIDLAQAEAIIEMITAPGREGARLAAAKLEGAFSRRISRLLETLNAMRMQIILAVDFPDEDAELLSPGDFARSANEAIAHMDGLLEAYERARLWREGALAVLAGRVNAGKSSLLNALLGRERAIVSPVAGTTRDYVEESLNIRGMTLRLCDTAGLRRGGDLVEQEGIRRSRDLAKEADILIFVIQAGQPLSEEEQDFLRKQEERAAQGRLLFVFNKIDLLDGFSVSGEGEAAFGAMAHALLTGAGLGEVVAGCPCYPLSARQGIGLEELTAGIYDLLTGGRAEGFSAGEAAHTDIAPNLRQSGLLRLARGELVGLVSSLAAGLPPDILAVHLDAAIGHLEEITGSPDNEQLMERIFSEFCIGK